MIAPSIYLFFFCKRNKNHVRVESAKSPFFSMCGRRLFFSVRARMSPSITAITARLYTAISSWTKAERGDFKGEELSWRRIILFYTCIPPSISRLHFLSLIFLK